MMKNIYEKCFEVGFPKGWTHTACVLSTSGNKPPQNIHQRSALLLSGQLFGLGSAGWFFCWSCLELFLQLQTRGCLTGP